MRIKAVSIHRYGPLRPIAERDLTGFVLVYGPNEQGKTLFLDAILKLLFKKDLGRALKHFGNIRRVDEDPEGFVILEDGGTDIKLDRDDVLSKFMPIGPTDFRNIFVVRDSDLGLIEEEHYYTRISERLAGLRTSEVEAIRRALQQRGRLTNPSSKGELSDSAGSDHVASKVKKAQRFINEIDEKLPLYLNSNYDGLERTVLETRERIVAMERELELLRHAEIRARFDAAKAQLDELRQVIRDLDSLAYIDDEDWEAWREAELEIKSHKDELLALEKQVSRQQERIEELGAEYPSVKAKVGELEQRKQRFEDALIPKLHACDEASRLGAQHQAQAWMWKWGIVTSLAFLALCIVGIAFKPSWYVGALAAFFLLATGFFAARIYRLQKVKARQKIAFDELTRAAEQFDVPVNSPEGLLVDRDPLAPELEEARRALREIDIGRQSLASSQFSLQQKVTHHNGRVAQLTDKIQSLRSKSGAESREAYREALQKKRELAAKRQSLETVLANNVCPKATQNPLPVWEAEIARRLATIPEDALHIEWGPKKVTEIEVAIRELKESHDEAHRALSMGRTGLQELELKFSQAGVLDGDVTCRTTRDLRNIADALLRFVEDVHERRDDALLALSLFEEIEAEEKARVRELFGAKKPVSKYFEHMSNGAYDSVTFDVDEQRVQVRAGSGHVHPVETLSGGAFDQLYLAVRLSMAESLLQEKRGFFILDDPFIKSDFARLRGQLSLMQQVAAAGWQVIYFSAKKEVMDLLERDIAAGRVQLIRMDHDPSEPAPRKRTSVAENLDLFSG